MTIPYASPNLRCGAHGLPKADVKVILKHADTGELDAEVLFKSL